MNKSERLRKLFKGERIIRVMGGYNSLGAKLAEETGFDAVWASGLEISTASCVPDANILTMTDFLNAASSMNEAVSIPVIADCDTGFGNSSNVIHMVKKYEAAGIAAVCIEDKHFPKVNSFIAGRQELASISEFVGKILAAKNAQTDKDFMVIARVEALIAGWGMEEALKRANAYVDAGADAVLIHSKSKTKDEIAEFAHRWKGKEPLIAIPTTYYAVTSNELEQMGFKMVIYANHGIRASIAAMKKTFGQIHKAGTTASVEREIASMNDVFELQGMHKMKKDELTYASHDKDRIVTVIPAAGDHLEEYSMKDISSDIPISMVDINGKPILQRQVETLNRCKVYDIRVIAGYKKDKISVDGVKVIPNDSYKDTGILYSIMKGLEGLNQRVFITYGDVLFDHTIFERLTSSPKEITIVVDRTYGSKGYGKEKIIDFAVAEEKSAKGRRLLYEESLRRVVRIGSDVDPADAEYEFPGITFLSHKGTKIFKDIFNKHRKKFKRAGMAELLAEAIKSGSEVYCLEINAGWMEIHSMDDYKLACSMVK